MSIHQPVFHFRFLTNEEFVTLYKKSLRWLNSLHPLNPSSRFQNYLKVIKELEKLKRNERGLFSPDELCSIEEQFDRKLTNAALSEGLELIEIYNVYGKSDYSNEIPNQLLSDITDGVDNYAQEGNNFDPRNKLFELFCAASFRKAGYKPKLTETPNSPDISFSHNRYKVFVECKRFASKVGFERNLKKAFKQLKIATSTYGSHNLLGQLRTGMVFMSITKVINPKQHLLVTKDFHSARAIVKKRIENLWRENLATLRDRPRGLLGVVLFCKVPVSTSEGLGFYRIQKGLPFMNSEDGDFELYKKIMSRTIDSGMPISKI